MIGSRKAAVQRSCSLAVGLVAGLVMTIAAPALAAPRTLGFVVTTWNLASYETRFIDECPKGLNVGYDELWWRSLPKAERARLTQSWLVSRQDRYFVARKRGRNGEDVCLDPTSVDDPPLLTVKSKIGYGFNLDGNTDGRASPKTCSHQNFTTPDGEPGIDNQLYRILGCVFGFRSFGYFDANPNDSRKIQGLGVVLIEITGVDDPRNDADVNVTFYRAIDPYPLDAASNFIPYATFRVDSVNGKPRYGTTVHGKIVNGVLTTEPKDTPLPYYGNYAFMDMTLRDMQLRLEISEDGARANGMFGGYLDADEFSYYVGSLGLTHATTYTDCPAIYVAAHQYADGYPDPATGKCTALSSAFKITAVAAFVSHPKPQPTEAGLGWKQILQKVGLGQGTERH